MSRIPSRVRAFHAPAALRAALGPLAPLAIVTFVLIALPGCQAKPPQAASLPVATPALATVAPAAPTAAPSTPAPNTSAAAQPDYWPTSGWKTSTPEQQGMDSARLAAMFDAIEAKRLNLHSVLIIRNGYLVTEAYFGPYTRDIKQQVASVTKSVGGMLTGIAIGQGKIKSVGEPLLSFFPGRKVANLDENKRNMTLEHLLSLTTGFACTDSSALGPMLQSPDWVQFALDMKMATAPGQQFWYCSPAAHLISPILQQATGKNERELANESLFAPLGIPAAAPADWATDPQGYPQGFSGLKLAPREMAKLGLLYLQGGNWDGKQVVPAAWVADSVRPHTTEENTGRGYGYLIWLYPKEGYESMMGLGGQDIHVIPDKNMVVVFTAAMDIPTHDKEVINLLDEFIVPAAGSNQPLPKNPAAAAELQARIARAASPQAPVPPLPDAARSISGKVYSLEPNPDGWRTISLSFQDGSAEAYARVNGAGKLPIGLDNVYRTTNGQGGPVALRGHWEGANIFVVDVHNPGAFVQRQYWMTVAGDQLVVEGKELVNGYKYSVTGRPAR